MIYATCSLLPEENTDQAEAFLERWEDAEGWRLVPVCEVWEAAVGTDCPMNNYATVLRLTPAKHGTDGFFTAVLKQPSD